MEEDPRDHDFDQRLDGPFQERKSTQQDTRQSLDQSTSQHLPSDAQSPTTPSRALHQLDSSTSRKGVQISEDRQHPVSPTGRKSTQYSRPRQSSRDFDVRKDGPYGRPSLAMSRRRSSGNNATSPDGRPGVAPATPVVSGQNEEEDRGRSHAEAFPLPPGAETLQSSTDPAFEPEPPPLNYSLWKRKWSIAFFWSLILIDCIAMPIALYFGLWYGTNLSPNIVFSIVTAALGGVSIIEYILRFFRLWKKGSTCRVIGARRAYLDWFHWNFSFGWVVIIVELVIGTIPENPPIRLLAMPLASMLYAFGTELLIVDICRYFEIPAPVRISSIPKGSQLRPGIYSIIEDVCAVDGSGGTDFREALNKRYEASHIFRAMLRRLGVFWAVGAESTAVVCTILIFTIPGEAAYVVGWTVPFVWAGIWTWATIWFVRRTLKIEHTAWAEEAAQKNAV